MTKSEKVSIGQADGYTTGCLLDFASFDKNYRLTILTWKKLRFTEFSTKIH